MAAITATTLTKGSGAVTATRNTLTASNTLTYVAGSGQIIELYNTTAGAVNVTFLGNGVSAFNVDGYGSVNPASGKVVAVAASSTVAVRLDDIAKYLAGTSVAVTGGTGVVAMLYSGTNA